MRRLVLLAQRIIRRFDIYFSIVLRKAAWASRDRESASLMITTDEMNQRKRIWWAKMSYPWIFALHLDPPVGFGRFPSRAPEWQLGRNSLPRCNRHQWNPYVTHTRIGTLPGSNFDVIIALNNIDLQLPFRRRKKYPLINFELQG